MLKEASENDNPYWYLYGRTQALKDVATNKLSINTTIKDVKSLKINRVPAGTGLYSGLYILTDFDFDIIENLLRSDKFINYIASLKKYSVFVTPARENVRNACPSFSQSTTFS